MTKYLGLKIILALAILVTPFAAQAKDTFSKFDKNGDGVLEKSEVPRMAHQRFNRMDLNGDGRITQEEASQAPDRPLAGQSNLGASSAPDYADIRYNGVYDRALMDIWVAEGASRSPVLVFFHGGGFVAGSKDVVSRGLSTDDLTKEGVAVVSVGYPFIEDFRGSGSKEKIVSEIYEVTEEAIEFLRENATRYNIDPNRIIVAGSSAGAMITTHLTISEPQAGVVGGLVLNQPRGAQRVAADINKGSLPLVMFTAYGPDNKMHPPSEAQKIYDRCKQVGTECAIYGTVASGLPELPAGADIASYSVDFILN